MSKSPNNDYATESNGGAFMTEVAVQEQEPVSRVEDETFQFYEDPAMQKLPTQTRWQIVQG